VLIDDWILELGKGEAVCFRLIRYVSFYFLVGKTHAESR